MVERDLWVLFATLELCPKAKLILMAGTVTGKYYMNEFLQRFAPDYGYLLDRPFNRSNHSGKGKTSWHCLFPVQASGCPSSFAAVPTRITARLAPPRKGHGGRLPGGSTPATAPARGRISPGADYQPVTNNSVFTGRWF
jgi:hypothetical protein